MTQEFTQGFYDNLEGRGGEGDGRRFGREGYRCTDGWFLLRYDRKPQNSVKQISLNYKKVAKKLDKIYCAAIHLGHLIVCCLCPDVSISTEIALTLGILNMLTWQLMNFARTYTFQITKKLEKINICSYIGVYSLWWLR